MLDNLARKISDRPPTPQVETPSPSRFYVPPRQDFSPDSISCRQAQYTLYQGSAPVLDIKLANLDTRLQKRGDSVTTLA